MITKTLPAMLGCGRPSATAYKGRITTLTPDDQPRLANYVTVYRVIARDLLQHLLGMIKAGGDDRLAVFLMVVPAKAPEDIQATRVWQEVVAIEKNPRFAGKSWLEIVNSGSLQHLFRAVAGAKGRATVAGDAFIQLLADYGIRPTSLTRELYEKLFGGIDSDIILSGLSNQVSGMLSAYLSSRTNAIESNKAKQAVLAELNTKQAAFFNPFGRWYATEGARNAAARHFSDLRHVLKGEGVDRAVTGACQWRAVLNHPEISAWQPVDMPEPEFLAMADANPAIVARFEQLMPATVGATIPEARRLDKFRRLVSKKKTIKVLARDPDLIRRILRLYQDHTRAFSPEQVNDWVENVVQKGPYTEHAGWEAICASRSPEAKAVREFVAGPVREFCEAMRPVTVPDEIQADKIWPTWANDAYGWTELTDPAVPLHGNEVLISLFIPRYRPANDGEFLPAQKIKLKVRGNLPGSRAVRLPQPIDVLQGETQFRPNQKVNMPGDVSGRVIYLKYQALRVTATSEGGLFGSFSATIMPELPKASVDHAKTVCAARQEAKQRDETPDPKLGKKPAVGERVATVQIAPGGLRIASLAVFERVSADKDAPTGWKQIAFEREVARTDDAAHGMRKVGVDPHQQDVMRRVIVHPVRIRKDLIANFEADDLDRRFAAITARPAAGYVTPVANELQMEVAGGYRTQAGKLYYRMIARRIAATVTRN
ncbi:MAG: hypothetical protein PHE83_17835, partial [Opitutaceae bacterium]|nr:hypothetical protein [Opitutaceae bacterium]